MTRMRYVKMDRIMNHMLIHALREVFRQEKKQGLPVDTTRALVLKLAEQEEGKLTYLPGIAPSGRAMFFPSAVVLLTGIKTVSYTHLTLPTKLEV